MTSESVSSAGIRASASVTSRGKSVPSANGMRSASACAPFMPRLPTKPTWTHAVGSPSRQKSQVPSEIANGITTTWPFFTRWTPLPTASTTPIASWPMLWPFSVFGMSLYGQRSLPQMHARTTRIIASVAWTIDGSGTLSTRTSPAPYMMVARISHLALVLLVGDLLEPLDHLAVERLLNRDVRHRRRRRGAMPVLLVWLDRDDVSGANLLKGAAPPLMEPATRGHDQRLAERMRMPVAARARLEG